MSRFPPFTPADTRTSRRTRRQVHAHVAPCSPPSCPLCPAVLVCLWLAPVHLPHGCQSCLGRGSLISPTFILQWPCLRGHRTPPPVVSVRVTAQTPALWDLRDSPRAAPAHTPRGLGSPAERRAPSRSPPSSGRGPAAVGDPRLWPWHEFVVPQRTIFLLLWFPCGEILILIILIISS